MRPEELHRHCKSAHKRKEGSVCSHRPFFSSLCTLPHLMRPTMHHLRCRSWSPPVTALWQA